MSAENNEFSKLVKSNNSIDIRLEIEKYLIYWRWFILSVVISLICSFLYLRYTTPIYTASTKIMIKNDKKGGKSLESAAFEQLGVLGNSSSNIDDEIEIFKSRNIIGNVVDNLNLRVSYFVESRIKKMEVYANNSPINLILLNVKDLKRTTFFITPLDKTRFEFKEGEEGSVSVKEFNKLISSSVGDFKVQLNLNKSFESRLITVNIDSKNNVIDRYKSKISLAKVNKNATVLIVTLNDPVKEKAVDILDNVVSEYNKDAILDKNQVSKNTKEFIEKRLSKIEDDLTKIDLTLQKFQDKNNITDIQYEAGLLLEESNINTEQIYKLETQVYLSNQIINLIKDKNEFNLLPSLLVEDPTIFKFLEEYNELVLRRNKILSSAGTKNPIVIEIEGQLTNIKNNLQQSLNNYQNSLIANLNQLKKQRTTILGKKSKIPLTSRKFIDVKRQQATIAELFTFLLKKKEETSISLAITVPPAKIIEEAYGTGPISPKKKKIYIYFLFLGLALPIVLIYLKNLLDSKIHCKKDIEDLTSVPFIGDIPNSNSNEKIVVGNAMRTSTAEAFRLVRTNLDFMLLNKTGKGNTAFITSTTSGEGKSFISINLAATLALSGKKILLMGMDLRAPKVTEYLGIPNRKGITNYITDHNLSIKDIVFNIPEIEGLDIIASGVIPPNPAELLMNNRVNELFEAVKTEYDFILVDTAPINLVTDTLLLSKYADIFLYVVRANYIDKRLLAVPEELYTSKKLSNMAIILNDTDLKRGYGYGGYGYGYGYGSGYIEDEKTPWYKKIIG